MVKYTIFILLFKIFSFLYDSNLPVRALRFLSHLTGWGLVTCRLKPILHVFENFPVKASVGGCRSKFFPRNIDSFLISLGCFVLKGLVRPHSFVDSSLSAAE